MATAEFTFNKKIYIVIKVSPFKVNYGRELRIDFEIREKGKHAKVEEFVKEMKEMHEEVKAVLRKSQKEMKKYVDKNRKKMEEYKVGNRMLISTKDFTSQMMKGLMEKLMKKYIRLYKVKKLISENTVELELLVPLRIHLVVNVSRIVLYKKQVERQNKSPPPPVEIEREKEYEIEKILNRQDVREKPKYLVRCVMERFGH